MSSPSQHSNKSNDTNNNNSNNSSEGHRYHIRDNPGYSTPPVVSQTISFLSVPNSSPSTPSNYNNNINNEVTSTSASTPSRSSKSVRIQFDPEVITNSSSSRPSKRLSSSRRLRRNRSTNNNNDNQNGSLTTSPSSGSSTATRLRANPSLVMKHRLRKINDYYEDQSINQDGQLVSRPLPPLPQQNRSDNGEGVGAWIVRRLSGRHERGNTDEMDTSGLLNHNFLGNQGDEEQQQQQQQHQDFSNIDINDNGEYEMNRLKQQKQKGQADSDLHRHYSLKERLQCQRPDRHLFPYRTRKENWHAMKTFLRRFYLILLIIPGWIIPWVLEAQGKNQLIHEAELKGEEVDEKALENFELSKTANSFVFFLNLLAMTHLGKAAGACMEELVPKLGMSIVSIFDAMTSSSVELAVAAFALTEGLITIVQAAMLGAILNNLLLIMGVSFCVGGAFHNRQDIQSDTAQTGANLLMIVTMSYAIPIALGYTLTDLRLKQLPLDLDGDNLEHAKELITQQVNIDIWDLSKVMAVIMLALYGCCLLYQYNCRHFLVTPEAKHSEEYTVHKRNVHYWFAGWAYGAALAAQIYSAKILVHAVEVLGKQFELNHSFIGFILLPIVLVADLQEEVIAIKESRANRLDRTIALMIGSCMQIALLVTPLLILYGWAIDQPLTFRFSLLETVILGGSVVIVNILLQDNQSNWFEGVILLAVYFMCAVAFYYQQDPVHGPIGGSGEGGGGGGGEGGGGH